jgi:hypothetical protein
MKKSEIYRVAQMAIVDSHKIDVEDKLEMLKELMFRESTEKTYEEIKAKEAEGNENESA